MSRTQKEEDAHLNLSHSISWGLVFASQGHQQEERQTWTECYTKVELSLVQHSPGIAEYPVEKTLSPKQSLTYTQKTGRPSNSMTLDGSVKSKFHFQCCIRDSEPHMPSPFLQRNLGVLIPKNESAKSSFPFLAAAVYLSAHGQSGSLAWKPTGTHLPTFLPLSSRREGHVQASMGSVLSPSQLPARLQSLARD